MSGITALGGVIVKSPSDVSLCGGVVCTGAVMPSQRPGTATNVAEAATAIEGGAACVGGFESRRQAALKATDGAGEQPPPAVPSGGDVTPLEVDAPDYSVRFDTSKGIWIVSWKWTGGSGPEYLTNTAAQYVSPIDLNMTRHTTAISAAAGRPFPAGDTSAATRRGDVTTSVMLIQWRRDNFWKPSGKTMSKVRSQNFTT